MLHDKDLEALTQLGDRHVVFGKGRIAWTGDSAQVRHAKDTASVWQVAKLVLSLTK